MNNTLYYIECTCIRELMCPNVTFHIGDVVYFNKNAASNEMYSFNPHISLESDVFKNARKYQGICSASCLPFTRQKKNAKKWQKRSYAEWIADSIKSYGGF